MYGLSPEVQVVSELMRPPTVVVLGVAFVVAPDPPARSIPSATIARIAISRAESFLRSSAIWRLLVSIRRWWGIEGSPPS